MQYNNIDIELLEILDLINFTVSNEFIDKWSMKYSVQFLKHFQFRLLHSLNSKRPMNVNDLFKYLTNKCKYSETQVKNFFESIDIEIYKPIIGGRLGIL
jgi:ubiquitin-protein ligase